ncbi:MAG: hypothetical protein JKY37_34970, partial [Nannocystaceae bacterium]|nr:hypothetical protein [Nannocystaceae bacterium]
APPGKVLTKKYSVKRRIVDGDNTTLEFPDHVRSWKTKTCRDTNRVDRIEGGRVYYKQRCRATGKTETQRTKQDPVVVPTSEATAIKRGDEVSLIVMTGAPWTGRVIRVERKEGVVQVRGVRMP